MKRWIFPFFKNITISGIVCVIGFLIVAENRVAGVLILAVYSTFMVVKSFRRPIPLGFLTAVLPGLTATCSYMIQRSVMDYGNSDLPLYGLLLGIVPGIIMGIVHRTYFENGRIWARKSFWYLVLWGISYITVQGAALSGMREISGGALALSGFTSSSLVMLSLFLVGKYKRGKKKLLLANSSSIAALILIAITTVSIISVFPLTASTSDSKKQDQYRNRARWIDGMDGVQRGAIDPDYYIDLDSDTGNSGGNRTGNNVSEEVLAAGFAVAMGQMLVAAIMAAIMSGAFTSGTSSAMVGVVEGVLNGIPSSGPRLIDPDNDVPLEQKNGKYLVWGKWVDYDEALRWVKERKASQAQRSAEIDSRFDAERKERQTKSNAAQRARGDRYDADTDTWYSKEHEDARLAKEYKDAKDKFNAAMLEKNRNHAADRLRGLLTKEGKDAGYVDDLIAAGQWDKICDIFRDRVYKNIKISVQEHASERNWAVASQVAEYGAKAIESAAKAGIAVLAGPATGGSSLAAMAAAGGATGAITGAGEGTGGYLDAVEKYGPINDKNWIKIAEKTVKKSAVGFLSGAKDGAVGVYCGGPGVSKTAKILIPAGFDATETLLRTGDLAKAGKTGLMSAVGDIGGGAIDKIGNRVVKEVAGTAWSGAMGGAGSYVNEGSFGEGVATGLINRTGSRLGNDLAQGLTVKSSDGFKAYPDGVDAEDRVRKTIDEISEKQKEIVVMKDQPELIRGLWDSRKTIVQKNPVTGAEETIILLDKRKAFNQLVDTASSRSAKLADPEVQQAIIDTRQKLISDPADEATIARVLNKPDIKAKMQEGDRLIITSFSTPGSNPGVGADKDSIMCIARPIEGTDQVQLIQIDRRHWENEAYDEFYKQTYKLGRTDADGNITPKTEPEFHRHKQALTHLKKRPLDQDTIDRVKDQVQKKVDGEIKLENKTLKAASMPLVDTEARQARVDALINQKISRLQGQLLTDDQINARAWAASRNQVFTDPYHMEASIDNSNQVLTSITGPDGTRHLVKAEIGIESGGVVRPVIDAEGQLRTGPGILEAQRGQRKGLIDAEGTTTMWKVKPGDYIDGNIPEAVAQTQKGIKQLIKLNEGQRQAGVVVPPMKPHVAEAMELVLRAPTDSSSSPETMQSLESAIRSIPKPDPSGQNPDGIPAYPGGIKEALEKLPEQNRMLGAVMPKGTPVVHQDFQEGPQAADDIRSAMRDAVNKTSEQHSIDNPPIDPAPPEPDDLEQRIRKLDEERARLARKIAENNQGKGE